LDTILDVLTQNIIPIFLVAGFGFTLRRWLHLDKQALSAAVFNVFSPCLVFSSLVKSELLAEELISLSLFALVVLLAMGSLGFMFARLSRLTRQETAAFILVVMVTNSGNYGLTLNQLRYGEQGLARAVVYYTTSTIIIYTAGIFIATLGRSTWRQGLSRLLRLPPIYAAFAAIIVFVLSIQVPTALMKGIEVAGAGAIPVMLLVLGMQMADLRPSTQFRITLPAVSIRLIGGPIIAILVSALFGLQGIGRSTSIIEASMPTAVFTIILATEFDLQPTAVTSIVVLSTLLSPLTVTATIILLGL
jgi:predicted permease